MRTDALTVNWLRLVVVLPSFLVISGAFLTQSSLLDSRGAGANIPHFLTIRDPKIDSVFKILFGEEGGESRTMAFLNSVLYSDKEDDRIEEIQLLDRTMNSMDPRNERVLYFDILLEARCRTSSGKRFVIEMQRQSSNAAAERWISYGARELLELSKRVQQDESIASTAYYDKLLPVKVVTILDFTPTEDFLKNDADVIVEWDIREKKTSQVVSNILSWSFICLHRFNPQNDHSVGAKSRAWIVLLKQKDWARVELTDELVANDATITQAYERIAFLTPEEERQADKSADLQRLVASKDAGLLEEGEARGKTKIAEAMLKSNMSVEQVAQFTGLSDVDVQVLKEQLEQKQ
mmetsp:Transcript_15971/g.38162  ORF Transcript_15971/g.38162 Transcript_15971/m.38162 type:complete len:350 (+) Transcript_15971:61-1110(+)